MSTLFEHTVTGQLDCAKSAVPPTPLDYAKTAAQLAQDLGTIREFSQQMNLTNSLKLIDQVITRLREHRYSCRGRRV